MKRDASASPSQKLSILTLECLPQSNHIPPLPLIQRYAPPIQQDDIMMQRAGRMRRVERGLHGPAGDGGEGVDVAGEEEGGGEPEEKAAVGRESTGLIRK